MRLVMKFGGTSLADDRAMFRSARHVLREHQAGHRVVAVVVSAMSGRTDSLRTRACQVKDLISNTLHVPPIPEEIFQAERDALLATGEQESAALMALCLNGLGIDSRSFQGWQVPLTTNSHHGFAYPSSDLSDECLFSGQDASIVPVVCGFQGVSLHNRITTLGDGGSDLTAVLLAQRLHADRCDIYTDVDGMKTADPRVFAEAKTIKTMFYEELLEMASLGATILQTRAARFAMEHRVHLVLRSSLDDPEHPSKSMTSINPKSPTPEPQSVITGITHTTTDCRITLVRLKDQPGIAARVFALLGKQDINVDMIAQVSPKEGYAHLSFTVNVQDHEKSIRFLKKAQESLNFEDILEVSPIGRVSVVGTGMKDTPGVAATMFRTLAEEHINIQVIATSEIKISVLVDADSVPKAVKALHKAYFPSHNAS